MFDQTFVNTHAQTRKPLTMGVSLALQTGLVAVFLIVPLMHPEILHPKLDTPTIFVAVKQMAPQPEPVKIPSSTKASRAFVVPTRVPDKIFRGTDLTATPEPDIVAGVGLPSAIGGDASLSGLHFATLPDAPAPRPSPVVQKAPAPSGPVPVSTGVQSAKLIFGPKPAYPQLARASRTQGTVKLQAIIAANGVIKNLKVMSGPPLLQKAALDAVQQWRYQPTLLSGNAVEVLTEIDVVFTLNQ